MFDRSQKRRFSSLIPILAIGVSCAWAAEARAQAPTANPRAAALYLAVCAPVGYTTISNEDTDVLRPGRTRDYTVTLQAGVSYCIFAAGDHRIDDLDIFRYDENANLIDRDTSTDAIPTVSVRPAWTGRFRVRIKNHQGYGAGYYALGIAY
jgi:hypothetical protein